MSWLANVVDRALFAYGRLLPYHPKKLHIADALDRVAREAWAQPRLAQLDGVRYRFLPSSSVGRSIYYLGDWEHWDTIYWRRTIKPGWTVVDVGANLGYYALLASRLIGPQGRVFAFEPTPSTYQVLLENIGLNRARNIAPYQVAMCDFCGSVSVIEQEVDGWNRIGLDGEPGAHRVPSLTLDRFVDEQKLERIDMIKVDIEGAEHKFLQGARATIKSFRPIIAVELKPSALATFGATVGDLTKELNGYELYRATWRGFGPLKSLPKMGQTFNAVALPRDL